MSKKKNNELLNELKLTNDEEIISNDRYRHFIAILYDKSDFYNFDDVMFNLRGFKYFAYIKHQPEKSESVEHYHVFISLDSATTISCISKRLGIPPNYIQYVKSVRASIRYLTHIDYPEKIQYKEDDVFVSASLFRKFKKCFEDVKSESDIIDDIYNWIDNWNFDTKIEKEKELVKYVNYNCYDTIYKRYRTEFQNYLSESIPNINNGIYHLHHPRKNY